MLSEKQQKWRADLLLALTEALDALKLCESDDDLRSATEVLAFIGAIIREDRRPASPPQGSGEADRMVLELAGKLVQMLQDPHPGLSMWVEFRNRAAVELYGALIEVGTAQLATKVWRPPSVTPGTPRVRPLEPPPPSRRLLLVDGDLVAGASIVESMTDRHIGCAWVKTLDEARRELDRRSFDAVVTELMIDSDQPTGLELLTELRPTGQPVIVVTAYSELRLVKEAINRGASYFIEKPFNVDALVRALESVWDEPRGLGHFVQRALDRAGLSPKEKDIARLVLKGLSTKEIEGVTGNTEKTIKHHIAAVYHKFDVGSRGELFHSIFPT